MVNRRPDQVTIREKAVIAGIGKSNVLDLERRGLLPTDSGVNSAKRATAIAAFMKVGFSLHPAAKIVESLLDEFNNTDREIPSQIFNLARKLPPNAWKEVTKGDNELSWHSVIVRHEGIYKRGKALGGDAIVDIVDGERIFYRIAPLYRMRDDGSEERYVLPILCPWTDEGREASFVGWIHGAERGSDVTVEPWYDRFSADPEHPTFPQGVEEMKSAEQRRRDAEAIVTVNLSLAIRNGFDRLADYRADEAQKKKARRQNTFARKRSKAVVS